MQLTHTIDIDLMNPGTPVRIQAKQGENLSRRVQLRLFAGGESWPVPAGATPVIRYHIHNLERGEDTNGIYNQFSDGSDACLVSGNTVLLIPLPQMFQKHCIVFLDVAFNLDGITLATCNFEFYVNPAPADGTEPEIQSYYRVSSLEQINRELTAMQQAIDAAIPSVTLAAVENGTLVTITDAKGAHSFTVYNGEKGEKGDTGPQGPQGVRGPYGDDGKSAYKYAVQWGYTGTETEFGQKFAALMNTL